MDENNFVSGIVEALSEQITILDSIEISVREAAAEYSELPNCPKSLRSSLKPQNTAGPRSSGIGPISSLPRT